MGLAVTAPIALMASAAESSGGRHVPKVFMARRAMRAVGNLRVRLVAGDRVTSDPPVELRCATIVFRGDAVLLVHRTRRDDWVLPGGRPRSREGVLACARRELREETGLAIDPGRCAFVLETIAPTGDHRIIEVVFLSGDRPTGEPVSAEDGMQAEFVPLDAIHELDLRPPLAGHLRLLRRSRNASTAPYLGNLWRPRSDSDDSDY